MEDDIGWRMTLEVKGAGRGEEEGGGRRRRKEVGCSLTKTRTQPLGGWEKNDLTHFRPPKG